MFHSSPPARIRTNVAVDTPPGVRPAEWPSFRDLASLEARFRDFVDYASLVLGHSAATIQWYRNGFRAFRHFLAESARPEGPLVFSPSLLEGFLAASRARGLGPRSLRTYWCAVKRFSRDLALRDGTSDPFFVVRGPGLPQHVYKALPPSQCERILAAALNFPWQTEFERARNMAMIAVSLYAGLRKREILRLQALDVDLDEGVIRVVRGKGRNGGKDRVAYIPGELHAILVTYLHQRRIGRFTAPEFFISRRSKGPVTEAAIRRVVASVRVAAGISFSLHVLRHSFVTMLLRSGVPIHVARDLAGHSSITTTEGYSRVFEEDRRRFVQVVRFRDAGHRAETEEVEPTQGR
jgi:site-specific recombinase XerD